jgi:hypothetical protein
MGRWSLDPPDYDEPEDDYDDEPWEPDEEDFYVDTNSLDALAQFYAEHDPCEP